MERSTGPVRGGEYQRPRRPNPDTFAYLKSLPLDVTAATDEIHHFLSAQADDTNNNSNNTEYPQTFAAALSVLEEIHKELASLAGDEVSAEIIEILARILAPHSLLAARKLLHACTGYALHLATHRYGSHVLQTILQLSVTASSSLSSTLTSSTITDLARHPDAPECNNDDDDDQQLPSLVDLLMEIQSELAPDACDLAVHICGSHVLRTLLCVLGGVELLQTNRHDGNPFRRGKKKNKKKKKKPPLPDSNATSTATRMVYLTNYDIRIGDDAASQPVLEQALLELTTALSGDILQAPGALQELACHSSGGPLLSVLLRVLTYRKARAEWQPKLSAWEDKVVNGVNHHLGQLRPEPRFALQSPAHKLAERILCWDSNAGTQQKWAPDVIFGLAGEARGSHCLETLLQLSPNEFYADLLTVGDFLSTKTLKEYAEDSVSRFVVQTIVATVRDKEQAEKLLQALEPLVVDGFLLDPEKKLRSILWRMVETAAKFDVHQESLIKSIVVGFGDLNADVSNKLQPCIPLLLDIKKPDRDGDRLSLDVAGTRSVHYLLRFEPKLCKHTLSGIIDLPGEEIELLIKDGLGSRCVLDGILEGPVKESVFSSAIAKLATKLTGRWVTLAGDRIGHHVVIKLFFALKDLAVREELVKEFVAGKKRLSGNAMGRKVLSECLVHEYEMNGTNEWNRLVKKRTEKDVWLDDIIHGSKEVTGKRKETDDMPKKSKKKQKSSSMGIDSIMDAIHIPSK